MHVFPCLLFILVLKTDFVVSGCIVANCDTNYCNDTICTRCINGYFLSGNSCVQCNIYCRTCQSSECYATISVRCPADFYKHDNCTPKCFESMPVTCSGCPDGFYENNYRCYRCYNANCKCTVPFGCDECLPGYFATSNYCVSECPGNCITCISSLYSLYCTKCQLGKYGHACELNCSETCSDGTCDIDSGICMSTCPSDQYRRPDGICKPCSYRCSSCTDFNNCTSCSQPHYWGTRCQYDCTGCFDKCNNTIGCSSGCDIRYIQEWNSVIMGFECIHCPDTCRGCDGSDQCNSCETGYWGHACQSSCDNCGAICDKNTGCGNKCQSGHYSIPKESGFECKPCQMNCETCIDSTTCNICENGYFVNDTKQCFVCPYNCKDLQCANTNGTCIAGCLFGHTGERCDKKCPENCVECKQFDSSQCTSCEKGFFGEGCNESCSPNCRFLECNKNDGTCLNSCEDGYWSETCSERCPIGCVNQSCNAASGLCFVTEAENLANTEQSDSLQKDNQGSSAQIIALSATTGILFTTTVVSVGVIITLLRQRKAAFPTKQRNNILASDENIETCDYQDLNRNRQDERTYSSITHDYENNF